MAKPTDKDSYDNSDKNKNNDSESDKTFREFLSKIKDFKVLNNKKNNPFENNYKNQQQIDNHKNGTDDLDHSSICSNYNQADIDISEQKCNYQLSEHLWMPSVNAEEYLFYFQQGVQNRTIRKMRAGKIRIEATLDLHKMNKHQARVNFSNFIEQNFDEEKRCICVIHGKGYRSNDDAPLLKNLVNHWLHDIDEVLGFCSCPRNLGGTGAVLILLKRNTN